MIEWCTKHQSLKRQQYPNIKIKKSARVTPRWKKLKKIREVIVRRIDISVYRSNQLFVRKSWRIYCSKNVLSLESRTYDQLLFEQPKRWWICVGNCVRFKCPISVVVLIFKWESAMQMSWRLIVTEIEPMEWSNLWPLIPVSRYNSRAPFKPSKGGIQINGITEYLRWDRILCKSEMPKQ